MADLDVSVVTCAPDLGLARQLFASFAAAAPGVAMDLCVEDNSPDPAVADTLARLPELEAGRIFRHVTVHRSGENVGFGRAHNANAARGKAPFLFVVNPDCVLEPGALGELLAIARAAADDVAAWELRQIPYEHPKAYDPATLETSWVSGAAVLLRRAHFAAVGGFDPAIFLYGEDVDLSWRLRARGLRLTYQPRCAVIHRTYAHPHEVKPVALEEGMVTHLCLRARYAGPMRTLKGLAKLGRELLAAEGFPGRRKRLARAGLRFLAKWPRFAFSRVAPAPGFRPLFRGWDYAWHRDGAFHAFHTAQEKAGRPQPLVSILIRTRGRPAWLREALASCANQTYRNLEVVVVEGVEPAARAVVAEFEGRLAIRYHCTHEDTGRARNGNLALAMARGEWLNFLDDDDVLFADHVEVMLEAALAAGSAGAYGLAWEVRTRIEDRERARYTEEDPVTRHRQRFDRMTLWHHNYLPIQAVLFHRRLYERHGGFDEAMEHLEDWNLWTRYTLEDDLVLVEKTTSKYRVPADWKESIERQALLDRAYAQALERQLAMRAPLSPREVFAMAEAHARRHRLLRRLAGRVPLAGRVLHHLETTE